MDLCGIIGQTLRHDCMLYTLSIVSYWRIPPFSSSLITVRDLSVHCEYIFTRVCKSWANWMLCVCVHENVCVYICKQLSSSLSVSLQLLWVLHSHTNTRTHAIASMHSKWCVVHSFCAHTKCNSTTSHVIINGSMGMGEHRFQRKSEFNVLNDLMRNRKKNVLWAIISRGIVLYR